MPFMEGIPTVVVVLDKPRTLGFTMGAMRRVHERLGTLEVSKDAAGALLALPAYLWACLDATDRAEITVEKIEDMIHPGNMAAINEAITTLLGASIPEAAADATAGPTQAVPKLVSG